MVNAHDTERRGFPRTGLILTVELTAVPGTDPEREIDGAVHGVTRDVSRGGCAVLAATELPEHSRCVARFPESEGRLDPDTMWARVRRTAEQPAGVLLGIEFETPLNALRLAPQADEPANVDRQDPRMLVVEDRPGMRGLLDRFFSDNGFDVSTAGDGEEAFRLLLSGPPDVLLLDLYMPKLNGHDLLRRMGELNITVPLIYTISGCADPKDAQECLRLGAADHVPKPLDLDLLLRSIRLRLGAMIG